MISRRHHYVPQGYLRGFSCAERGRQFVWVYDKRPGRLPRCKSVKSVAWAPAYYSQERDDGSLDTDTLEKNLAKSIDSKAAELLADLNHEAPELTISEEQRGLLAFFIALSLTRVPSFRDGLRNLYTQIAQYTAELVGPELWSGPGPMPPVKAEAKEWVTLEHMIEGAQQIANSLVAKNWQFFRAPDNTPFITSDNPAVFNGMAPAHPDCEVIMALTKHLAIVCTPRSTGVLYPVFDAPRQQVKSMNTTIAKAARTRFFASENSAGLERLAKKYSQCEQKIAT
jgi:hypothetical protein